jgi:hypothetical protein
MESLIERTALPVVHRRRICLYEHDHALKLSVIPRLFVKLHPLRVQWLLHRVLVTNERRWLCSRRCRCWSRRRHARRDRVALHRGAAAGCGLRCGGRDRHQRRDWVPLVDRRGCRLGGGRRRLPISRRRLLAGSGCGRERCRRWRWRYHRFCLDDRTLRKRSTDTQPVCVC